jgi:hypothetical protein
MICRKAVVSIVYVMRGDGSRRETIKETEELSCAADKSSVTRAPSRDPGSRHRFPEIERRFRVTALWGRMPIATAVQRGTLVYVYDEKGRQLMTIPAGNKPEDHLTGYTSTTVSVRRGGLVYTYNEKGGLISTHPAR